MGSIKHYGSIILDVIGLAILGILFAILRHYGRPTVAGFFCYDSSIRYPYKDSTVPVLVNICFSYCLPILLLIFIHVWLKNRRSFDVKGFLEECSVIIFFGLTCQITTHILKLVTGRLRPHFIEVCGITESLNQEVCGDVSAPNYVTEYSCPGNPVLFPTSNMREHRSMEARLSFPSGHSSVAFFGMCLAVLLVQKVKMTSLLAPFLQILCLLYASYVGISRITDHKHHPGDVIGGAVLGIIFAVAAASRILTENPGNFYSRTRSCDTDANKSVDQDMQGGRQRTRTMELFDTKTDVEHMDKELFY